MAKHVSNDERSPDPAGVEAGPQGGPGGAGGEPKGAQIQARQQDRTAHDRTASQPASEAGGDRPEHSSNKDEPGYRARPAGQSGLGEQDDRASTIREPQGDGNYVATDRGDKPLRNG